MKKYLSILLSLAMAITMVFTFVACGDDEGDTKEITEVVTNEAGDVIAEYVLDEDGNKIAEYVTDENGEKVKKPISTTANANDDKTTDNKGNKVEKPTSGTTNAGTTGNSGTTGNAGTTGNSGNSGTSASLVGKWKATLDMDEMTEKMIGEGDELGMAEYFNFENCEFVMNATFKSDGTYELAYDKDSVEKALKNMTTAMKNGLEAYFKAMLGDQMSLDDALAMMGMGDLDSMIDEMMAEGDMDEFDEVYKGKYKLEGGKFYVTEDMTSDFDEGCAYTLTANKFTLTPPDGLVDEDIEMFLSLEFVRA